MLSRSITALTLTCLVASAAMAADWPQWMGPNRDGMTAETGLLQSWPEGGPKRVWMFEDCGVGYSGPAIVDGKLYLMGARDSTESLLCLDAETGKELWKTDLSDEFENDWGNGPRGTPTVDGDRLYVMSAPGVLACLNRADGSIVWQVKMSDFGGEVPFWGYSESPLIDGDKVIVTPGGDKGAIVALNKTTGELIWQSAEITTEAHYTSAVAATINGQEQYVQLLLDQVVGIEPATGKLLWTVPWAGKIAVIPTPVIRDNKVYVTTGYGVGCMLVEVAPGNEASAVYTNKIIKNHHGGVLLLGDHIYGHSDGVGWVCQDFATGKRVWRERKALDKGAIAYADGRFYCLGEDTGDVALIEASPEGWTQHGRFTLDPQTEIRKDKGKVWTHPVIANGKMYLRDQDLVYCYDISAE